MRLLMGSHVGRKLFDGSIHVNGASPRLPHRSFCTELEISCCRNSDSNESVASIRDLLCNEAFLK